MDARTFDTVLVEAVRGVNRHNTVDSHSHTVLRLVCGKLSL
jgi:hypothetical protein